MRRFEQTRRIGPYEKGTLWEIFRFYSTPLSRISTKKFIFGREEERLAAAQIEFRFLAAFGLGFIMASEAVLALSLRES